MKRLKRRRKAAEVITRLFGLPLLHASFKYRPNRVPVVAKGIVAIGHFGCGVVTIAQFGVGLVCISQFALAGLRWLSSRRPIR